MSAPHSESAHFFDSVTYEDVYEHFDDEGDSLIDPCPEQPCPHCNNTGEPDERYLVPTPLNRVLVETELLFNEEQCTARANDR